MVQFDSNYGMYYVEVPSDSNALSYYVVLFDPSDRSFRCECPAFRYSREFPKTCKHVERHSHELVDYVDGLDRLDQDDRPNRDEQDEIRLFTITLNNNETVIGDLALVKWLLSAVNYGDKLTVQRR